MDSAFRRELLRWMQELDAAQRRDIAALLHGYCRLLARLGVAVFRVSLPLTTLHQQSFPRQSVRQRETHPASHVVALN